MSLEREYYGSCPNGGSWYKCTAQSPTFFGCCTSNPCDGKGCPQGNLRAAGLGYGPGLDVNDEPVNASSYTQYAKCPATAPFYTCSLTSPQFQGCCASDPCKANGVCPSSDLFAAEFNSTPPDPPPKTSIASSKALPSATLSFSSLGPKTSSSKNEPVSATSPAAANSSTGLPTPVSTVNYATIAGGAAAGSAILVLAIAIFFWIVYKRRKRSSKNVQQDQPIGNDDYKPVPGGPDMEESQGKTQSPGGEGYYTSQPIDNNCNAPKHISTTSQAPLTPGPPPYQSPASSPNPNVFEIDSSSNVNTTQAIAPEDAVQLDGTPITQSLELGNGVAELGEGSSRWTPMNPPKATGPSIGISPLVKEGLVEMGPESASTGLVDGGVSPATQHGSPDIGSTSPAGRNSGRQTYTSWQNLSH